LQRTGPLEGGTEQRPAVGQAQKRFWIQRRRNRPEPAAGATGKNDW